MKPTFDPFIALVKAHGLPEPETEVVFLPPRKFKADYCWRDERIVVEKNGGVFMRNAKTGAGAHALPSNILRDYEKCNLAQLAGWTYLQFTPKQLLQTETIEMLKTVFRMVA